MSFKQNYRIIKRVICILFLIPVISSCSFAGKVWYERLDLYLANYFFKYAEFSPDQKAFVRSITKQYQLWNKNSELPKYKNLILEISQLTGRKISTEDIKKIFDKGELLFQGSNNFFTPHIVSFCKTLSDKQVEEINSFFENRINNWRESEKEKKQLNPGERVTSGTKQLARLLGVKLNQSQIQEIKKLAINIDSNNKSSIDSQEKWNKTFITILRDRQNKNFENYARNHLNSLLSREVERKGEATYHQIIVATISSLNQKQEIKFQRRLNLILRSIDKLIKS